MPSSNAEGSLRGYKAANADELKKLKPKFVAFVETVLEEETIRSDISNHLLKNYVIIKGKDGKEYHVGKGEIKKFLPKLEKDLNEYIRLQKEAEKRGLL